MAERTSNNGEETGPVDGARGASRIEYRTTHDMESDASLSITVIEALAEAMGVSPMEIEHPLYDVVDPDALDRLFTSSESAGAEGRVVFTIDEYEVTVTSVGDVVVEQLE